ncbi:hypothetical protein [Corynebacterium efficiens]|nr:hypothetical protein [Corynebacterium efficiens]
MDLSTPSPGYNTSPEERLTAFLIKDLQRHFPEHEGRMMPYARELARAVTRYARRLELED